MRWTSMLIRTRAHRRNCRLLFALGCGLAISACAGNPAPSVADLRADAPRLEQSAWAREPCAITTTDPETVADLEARDRARGLDVRECDNKRALAVMTSDEEHRLEDLHATLRAKRTSRACRWFGVGCG